VARWNGAQKPDDPREVSENTTTSTRPAVDVVDVELDVTLAVSSEANDLLHPRSDLVVAVLGLGEVEEQAVHALHFVPDELDVTPDAAEQLCLVDEDGGEAAQERVEGALGVHLVGLC
jgi:hypothetical protein